MLHFFNFFFYFFYINTFCALEIFFLFFIYHRLAITWSPDIIFNPRSLIQATKGDETLSTTWITLDILCVCF